MYVVLCGVRDFGVEKCYFEVVLKVFLVIYGCNSLKVFDCYVIYNGGVDVLCGLGVFVKVVIYYLFCFGFYFISLRVYFFIVYLFVW